MSREQDILNPNKKNIKTNNKSNKEEKKVGGIKVLFGNVEKIKQVAENRRKKHEEQKLGIFRYKNFIVLIATAILVSSILVCKTRGFNKGVDFAGGMVIETICENCDARKISNQIHKDLKISITHQSTNNGYVFKMPAVSGDYNKTLKQVDNIIKQNGAKIVRSDFASPQITESFIQNSISACLFAFVGIGLYIIIRFSPKFAIAGVLALIFDVIATIGFISFAQIEFSLITLTALLTIIGYCINDKIVIFDRIRTNIEYIGVIGEIVKKSVMETLTRSVMTSFTTIVATTSLLFFGDRSIADLGTIIIVGVVIGTISSLALAPSLLLVFGVKRRERKTEKSLMFYAS